MVDRFKRYWASLDNEAKTELVEVLFRAVASIFLTLLTLGLAWYWYDLKLAAILFLLYWAANTARRK